MRPLVIRSGTSKCFSPEERSQAVRELCNRRGTARKVAQSIGVSVPVLYKWKKDLISDEAYQSMRKRKAAPQDKNQDALLGEIQRLRKQVHQLQLERDILTKANELIKKDLGVSLKLKNREKTLIVDALKKKYPVAELLSVLQLAQLLFLPQSQQTSCTISKEIRVIRSISLRRITAVTATGAFTRCFAVTTELFLKRLSAD
jgi:transposase-like protein